MKHNKLFSILFICNTALVFGQTINNSVSFVAGDTHIMYGDTIQLQEGPSGQNVTWNFSSLNNFSDTIINTYVTPSSTPFLSSFPGSNLAMYDGSGFFTYYLSNGSELSNLGLADSSSMVNFSNSQKIFGFPMTYNSSYNDNFSGTMLYDFGFPVNGTISGSIVSNCDASGTLILPIGSYMNTLRRRILVVVTTTITFVGQTSTYTDTTESFEWYHPSVKGPLLVISESIAPDSLGGSSYFYQINNQINANLQEKFGLNKELKLFPNPTNTGEIAVILNLRKVEDVRLNIIDAFGKVIDSDYISNVSKGSFTKKINTNEYSKGIYFLSLQTSTQQYTQKFVIE